jgi:hypothetical protein
MPLLRHSIPRLPVRHVYRAFPELDGYSDEQCIRFMKAARGTMLRRAIAILAILTIFVVGTIAGAIILLSVVNMILPSGHTRNLQLGRGLVMLCLLLICTAAGPILAFLMRDFLIIDRIRWILRSRGLCQACSYSLIGLAVSPDNSVTCPECAALCTVDPSLGELTTGDGGTRHFKPDDASHVTPPLLQRIPDSIKLAAKVSSRVALVLLCVLAVLALAYEGTIQWRAGRARAAQASIRAELARLYPPESQQHPSPISIVKAVVERSNETYKRIITEHWDASDDNRPARLDPGMIHRYAQRNSPSVAYYTDEQIDAMKTAAELTVVQAIRDSETIRLLTALHSSHALFSFDTSAPLDEPLIHQSTYQLGYDAFQLVQILEAYAETSRLDNDRDGFMLAAETLLALNRLFTHSAAGSSVFTSTHCRRAITQCLSGMLSRGIPGEWLDELHDVAHRQGFWDTTDLDTTSLHLVLDEFLCYYFGAPDRFRLGKYSAGFRRFARQHWGQNRAVLGATADRIGSLRENRDAIDQYYAQLAQVLSQPAATTAHLAQGLWTPTSIILVDSYTNDPSYFLTLIDLARINTAGFRIQLAIERFQHDQMQLPESLEQLVPTYLDELPIDHWGDGVFRYIKIDPEKDEHNRSYLLYSVGADEQDDGGTPHPDRARQSFLLTKPVNSAFVGFDYVINDPSR